jgi:hypothetical protein
VITNFSHETSSPAVLQKKKKTLVFGQYANSGESIHELEQTAEKRKIDELMGRVSSTESGGLQ